MEVAGRDGGEARVCHPAVELRAVEELESVGEPAQTDVAREALRQPRARERGLVSVRVRRDDRGAGLCGRCHGLGDPVVHRDEAPQAQGERMCRHDGLGIVERQLEAGNDEHSVGSPGAARFPLDLREVAGPRLLVDRAEEKSLVLAPGIVGAYDVIGHAENVEPTAAVEVDELGDGELTVAPACVRVELAEQRSESSAHRGHRDRNRSEAVEKSGGFPGKKEKGRHG